MRFSPEWEKEIEPGIYSARVAKAEDGESKNGTEMIVLTLEVAVKESSRTVTDYLVASERLIMKIKSFCQAANLMKHYENHNLRAQDCLGRSVNVHLIKDDKWGTKVVEYSGLVSQTKEGDPANV